MSARFDSGRLRRVLVLGLGLSGTAAARLLLARGAEVVGVDRRPAAELELAALAGAPGFELRAGDQPAELPAALDALVVSPGVALDHPLLVAARAADVPVAAEVELAAAFLSGTIVAITGSNGKSTTTAMAGAMLARAGFPVEICGNIGLPLAAVVEGPPGRTFVVELSSFQLETIHGLRPRAAALLNLSPDHLDRHGDLAGYLAAKRRIFLNQTEEDVAVVNADEADVAASPTRARKRAFSSTSEVRDGAWLRGGEVVEQGPADAGGVLFAARDVPLPGPHNLENAMAAALLARAAGADAEAIRAALREFRGLPHRLERVGERGGVVFYDDSKGTNVAATARSLEGFADGTVHVVLGGRSKGADLSLLRPVVARKARRAYLIGESAVELERALRGAVELSRSETLAAAVREAAERARTGESVVLSPACASFDQFRDYRDRGRRFRALVRALPGVTAAGGADGQEARV